MGHTMLRSYLLSFWKKIKLRDQQLNSESMEGIFCTSVASSTEGGTLRVEERVYMEGRK